MVRLMCPHCRLSYAGATLPPYLAASAGASCPRCSTPLTQSNDNVDRAARPRRRPSAQQRHERAVEQTLSWAEQAAAAGSYAEALSWLATIEAIDGTLSPAIDARRRVWATRACTQTAGAEAATG